jgi:hypothetical protein
LETFSKILKLKSKFFKVIKRKLTIRIKLGGKLKEYTINIQYINRSLDKLSKFMGTF